MASPFTYNTAKPADTDAVNIFPLLDRGDKATLATPSATGGVLGTLGALGTPNTGWRENQVNDDAWLIQNAWLSSTTQLTRDSTAKAVLVLTEEVSGPYFRWLYLASGGADPTNLSSMTELMRLTPTGLAVGASPASSGQVRLPYNAGVTFRNQAGNADVNGWTFGDSSDLNKMHTAASEIYPDADGGTQLGEAGNRFLSLFLSTILSVGTTAQTGTANRFRMLQSMAAAHASVGQTLTSGTATPMALGAADFNTDSMWSSGANTKLTAQVAGKYMIVGQAATGTVSVPQSVAVRKNGATTIGNNSYPGAAAMSSVTEAVAFAALAATDYVELLVTQFQGGNITYSADGSTFMAMTYLGE